jgi:hypothetical protein
MCGLFIHPILTYSCYVHIITTYQMFWCIHMPLFYSKIFHLKTQTQTYSCNIWSLSYCHLFRLYLSFIRMLEFWDLSCEAKCQFGIWRIWIVGCNIFPLVVKIIYSLNVCLLVACKELWQFYVSIFYLNMGLWTCNASMCQYSNWIQNVGAYTILFQPLFSDLASCNSQVIVTKLQDPNLSTWP